jgi:hypothetical protein
MFIPPRLSSHSDTVSLDLMSPATLQYMLIHADGRTDGHDDSNSRSSRASKAQLDPACVWKKLDVRTSVAVTSFKAETDARVCSRDSTCTKQETPCLCFCLLRRNRNSTECADRRMPHGQLPARQCPTLRGFKPVCCCKTQQNAHGLTDGVPTGGYLNRAARPGPRLWETLSMLRGRIRNSI